MMFRTFTEARGCLYWLVEEGLRFSTGAMAVMYQPNIEPEEIYGLGETQQWILTQLYLRCSQVVIDITACTINLHSTAYGMDAKVA